MADQTTKIPKGWKMTTLGEVVEFQRGFDLPTQDRTKGKYPLIASTGIDGFVNEYKVQSPGVVTGRSGSLGKVLFVKENFWPLNTTLWIKDFKCNDEKFIYYWLLNFPFEKYNAGTGVPTLNRNHIHQVEVMIPIKIEEQRAIAAVLSSLDDKIELLREQNKTLEATAQTIFKEWFVRFNFPNENGEPYATAGGKMIDSELGPIPEGWRVGRLGDEVDITIGRTPPRAESEWFSAVSKGKKWISIKDIVNSEVYIWHTAEFLTDAAVEKFSIPVIPENTAILSFKMTVGKLAITTEKMLSNEAIAHLKINDSSNFSTEYIFSYLKGLDFNSLGSTSSIVTAINSTMIKNLNILIPNKLIMNLYNQTIQPIFRKMKNNTSQIQTLSTIRDTLLPKLMKGELRVEGFKE
jgi:type I restriction enzyme S subunit